MRPIATFTMLLGLCVCATCQGQADPLKDAETFRRSRAEKALLDQETRKIDFGKALTTLRNVPDGYLVVSKAVGFWRSQPGLGAAEKCIRCLDVLVEGGYATGNRPENWPRGYEVKVPEKIVLEVAALCTERPSYIAFLGNAGATAKAAMPILLKLREGQDQQLSLAAFRAIQPIQAALQEKQQK